MNLLKRMTEFLNQAFKLSSGFLAFCQVDTCKSRRITRLVKEALWRVFPFAFWGCKQDFREGPLRCSGFRGIFPAFCGQVSVLWNLICFNIGTEYPPFKSFPGIVFFVVVMGALRDDPYNCGDFHRYCIKILLIPLLLDVNVSFVIKGKYQHFKCVLLLKKSTWYSNPQTTNRPNAPRLPYKMCWKNGLLGSKNRDSFDSTSVGPCSKI